jgi:hypothetical protein
MVLVAQTFDCWSPQGLSLELTGAITWKISGGRRCQALSPHLPARRRVCSLIKLDLGPWQLALGGQEIVQTFQASATEPHRARHLKSHGWEPIGTACDAGCNASAIVARARPFIVLLTQSALQQTARSRVIFLRGLSRAKGRSSLDQAHDHRRLLIGCAALDNIDAGNLAVIDFEPLAKELVTASRMVGQPLTP